MNFSLDPQFDRACTELSVKWSTAPWPPPETSDDLDDDARAFVNGFVAELHGAIRGLLEEVVPYRPILYQEIKFTLERGSTDANVLALVATDRAGNRRVVAEYSPADLAPAVAKFCPCGNTDWRWGGAKGAVCGHCGRPDATGETQSAAENCQHLSTLEYYGIEFCVECRKPLLEPGVENA